MRYRVPALLAALLIGAAPADRPIPGQIRVRLVTSAGAIIVALDARHAPKTVANFMIYVDDGRLDDTQFYRSARRASAPRFGFVQGGIGTDAPRSIDPVVMERTDRTGLHHLDGTISMAHGPSPNSATGNFSIMVGAVPTMDARGPNAGYAAFGHVVAGMEVVRHILAMPTGGGFDEMKGQLLFAPVRILRAERLDGTPRPSGRFKTWLVFKKR